jgi:hypothetical protein
MSYTIMEHLLHLLDYLILSRYLTAYHWDCHLLSFASLPPHPACLVPYQMTCLSGLVTFHTVLWCSITITGTTSISGTTTGTLSISGFPTTTTSSIHLASCTI